MRKIITTVIIVILALGLGYYLFKISGGTKGTGSNDFDLSGVQPTDKIRDLQSDDHVLGNPQAKNIMVAFEDIQCPACKNYEPTLKSFVAELPDTKVVFRHFPLVSVHKNASSAAYASEAASAQGKFWEWVSLAYERQENWQGEGNPLESFVEIARDAGVGDLEKFRNDVANKTFRERVQADVREAAALGAGGTPSLYFNGVKLQVTGLDGIKQQVEKLYK
ncbi:MAG: thioredoxin domain-containing protein [Patescibacteria group bacterium]